MTTFASSAFSIVGSRSEMEQLIASSSSPSPPSSVAVNVTALSKPLPSLPLFFVSLLAGMTGWYLPKYVREFSLLLTHTAVRYTYTTGTLVPVLY